MAWIKCEDRLPDIDEIVIAEEKGEMYFAARRHVKNEGWYWCTETDVWYNKKQHKWVSEDSEMDDLNPTHWHPLPTPEVDDGTA